MKQNKELDQWGPIDAKILYMSFWFSSVTNSSKTKWQATWPNIQGIFQKDRTTFVWDKKEMEIRGTWVIENIILNNKTRKKLWQEYEQAINKARKFTEKIVKIKKELKLSENLYNSLCPYAAELYKTIKDIWDLGIIPELANFAAPDYLKGKLSTQVPADKMQEVLQVLLTSKNFSYHQQSELELLQAALENDFDSYAAKWFWVENGIYESKVLNAEYFKDKVNNLSDKDIRNKINKIKDYSISITKRKKEIVKQYKLSTEILDMTENLAYSIWWQDDRKGISLWFDNVIDIFSKAAASELKIDFDEILHYRSEEWLGLLKDKVIKMDKDFLKRRYNLSLFELIVDKGEIKELHNTKAEKNIDSLALNKDDNIINKELKGVAVSRGKISGKVRVLLSYRQADKMKEGEILVAPMTSPDYILAMRKAAAIITDVGGLMSHAAIVSRELGIPCITGTKIATKVLKDGDMVEVDAEQGIIRKIK